MIEFLLTFLFLVAIIAMMAIGVMRGRAPISGTCGGLNNIGADGECEICGGNQASSCSEIDKIKQSSAKELAPSLPES